MLFSMAAGTDGHGTRRFSLYLPFELAEGRTLQLDEGGSIIKVGDVEFKAERLHYRYAISGGEFQSEDEARSHLLHLQASLLWFSLKHKTGLKYPEALSDVRLLEKEITISTETDFNSSLLKRGWTVVHGDYDADKAVVKPEHLCLTRWETGQMSVKMHQKVESFEASLQEAATFPAIGQLTVHPKLKLGIELYAANHFELSGQAQFLTLVAALEATLESEKVSETALGALKTATDAVQDALANSEEKEHEELKRLLDRIHGLKQQSISKRFQRQVADRGEKLNSYTNLEETLKSVYDTRSKLLHNGKADLERIRQGLGFLRDFVPEYLTHEFKRIAGAL